LTKHTILFLAANPLGTTELALGREARAIQEELERGRYRDQFELVTRWAVKPLDLLRELRNLKPRIVHFSGHGVRTDVRSGAELARDVVGKGVVGDADAIDSDRQCGLLFEGPDTRPQPVSTAALKETFGAAGASVKLVVLNACYSDVQADALLVHVGCVVGMSGSIRDESAKSFAIGFYGGLGERESVAQAYWQGRAAIALAGGGDGACPQLKTRDDTDAARLFIAEDIQIFSIPVPRRTAAVAGVSVICAALAMTIAVGVYASSFPTKGFLGALGVGAILLVLAITSDRLPREQTGNTVKWLATLIMILIVVLSFAGVYGLVEAMSSPSTNEHVAMNDGGQDTASPTSADSGVPVIDQTTEGGITFEARPFGDAASYEPQIGDLPMRCVFGREVPSRSATCMIDGVLRDEELIDNTRLLLTHHDQLGAGVGQALTDEETPDPLLIPGLFARRSNAIRTFTFFGNVEHLCNSLREISVTSDLHTGARTLRSYKIYPSYSRSNDVYCDVIVSIRPEMNSNVAPE
jgi:hypothetical protein